ncbi:MAG TPA: nitroreductase family protein [Bacteroidales bacterium]|nr:nitroreductase family protein [Bacteroidales bacterium]HRZ76817.1 nitroreductase family protein [Bacteroidales bacterium]
MDTLHTLLNHRTIRNYLPDPVPSAVLDDILNAASRASTTGNMQVYSIIVTRDPALKEALYPLHFRQEMVRQAPLLLTFCADFNRFNQWCLQRQAEPGYGNFLSFFTASIDALLASQNAAVAAEAHGLGICYLGTTTYMAAEIASTLNCPAGVVPVTTLVVGYPAGDPGLTDRLPLEAVVHQETYRDYTPEDIDRLYAARESLPLTLKLLEENQLDTLAQVFTQKRYTRRDNEAFSKKLMDFIQRQGFGISDI